MDYSTAPQPKQGFIDGYKGLAAQATPLGQTNDLNTRLRELTRTITSESHQRTGGW